MGFSVCYNDLRDRRIKNREEIVLGRAYLICHVPMDNPFTHGCFPSCSEKKIVDVQFLSHNDIHTNGKRHLFRDKEAFARLLASDILNEKAWLFRTEEPGRTGGEYISWSHFSDHGVGPDAHSPVNFILDLEKLSAEGITVLRTTSQTYVMSDSLKLEREYYDWLFDGSLGGLDL